MEDCYIVFLCVECSCYSDNFIETPDGDIIFICHVCGSKYYTIEIVSDDQITCQIAA